jgi:ABC-2 type transport system ATP-binding protein
MTVLEAHHLTKQFGKFTAVDDVSLTLEEGEILGILGANGAGKTTTIQMLLGVLTPTAGEVRYFGKSLAGHREEILEQVNFSSTYTHLPWHLTVRENLTFVSWLYSIKDRNERVEEVMRLFRLEELRNKQMSELSAGQITRVSIAKSFINFPKVLLLDEPTASLDPEVADYIRKFLLEERRRFQVSIVFTSHNMSEVEEVCDRVVFIDKGKVIANDTPANLARSIEVCHIDFLVTGGISALRKHCGKKGIACRVEGRRARVDVPEKGIARFLQELTKAGVSYDEISIDRPTLEDYFLQVVSKQEL